jgi:hypothetical protein
VTYGTRDLFIDLAAERTALAAEKNGEKIAVEIQSFLNPSEVRSLQEAIGRYELYRAVLKEVEPNRPLFLAVPRDVYDGILSEQLGQLVLTKLQIHVLVFDEATQKVIRWINSTDTGTSSAK